nr:hypothetical protein [Tanacetum cinerariifolium]
MSVEIRWTVSFVLIALASFVGTVLMLDCGVLPEADHCQPPQYTVNHLIFNAHNDFLHSQNELTIAQNKLMEQMTQLTSMCEMACQIVRKKQEENRIKEEQAAKAQNSKIPACCDDDNDYNSAITPNEPVDSLSMGDEHLNTIPATESDEFIKSCIDSLLDEFVGELTLLKSIPPGIDKTDCYPEEEIRLTKRLLYDNSSLHPPKDFFLKILMLKLNLSLHLLSALRISYHFDIPSFSRTPAKPPDGNTGILNIKMMGDVSNQKVPMPRLMITRVSNQEKSPDLLSHRSLEIFQRSAKCPMMIHGKNIPILDVSLFYFYPLDQLKYGGNWVMLSDLKQALRGRHPMLINCGVLPEADHCQTLQYTVNHPIFNAHNDLLSSRTTLMEQMTTLTSMCEMVCQIIQKKQEEKQIEEEQAANARNSKILACCDDDDDYNFAITPNEPVDSLSMGDEHLNTILATESNEFIKSCVENLVLIPSESEGENGCDVLACFTTFLNIRFDAEYEFDSSDDQSLSDEDFLEEIFSSPLFEEEIISTKIDPSHFNVEFDLIESMLNHDSSIISSSLKINSLLDEFAGELTLLKSIPSGIDKTDCYLEEDIRLIERLLYDNSSPRLPKEFVSKNSDADIESFSPSTVPDEDSDSRMEEINLSFNPDDQMPPRIEEDDYDSERDVLILEELLDNYSLSLHVIVSYHFDIPSFSRPPAKPPDGNTGILNIKMMGDVSDQKVPIPGLTITRVPNQEKSPDLFSHRGFEIFHHSARCPMMIHGKNIPIMDVPLFHFYPLDQFKYMWN